MSSAGISFGGLASGLDTKAIISALVSIEQRPIVALEKKKAGYTKQKSLYGDLNGLLGKLTSAAKALQKTTDFLAMKAVSDDETAIKATASSSATPGTYTLRVDSLARAQVSATSGSPAATTSFGSNPTLEITVGGTTHPIAISGTATLESIAQSINAYDDTAAIGVRAEVVDTGNPANGGAQRYQLVVRSTNTGLDGAFTMGVDEGSVEFTNLINSMAMPLTAASNAKVTINGALAVYRESNEISDLFAGITLDLLSADPAKDITITVSNDAEATTKKVQEFVDAYNKVVDFFTEQNVLDAEGKAKNPLFGDATLRSMRSNLRSVVGGSVAGTGNDAYQLLSQLGITSDKGGKLTLNSGKLAEVLADDEDAVASVFTHATNGIAKRLVDQVDVYTDTVDGLLKNRNDTFDRQVRDADTRITQAERRLTLYEKQLEVKYANLEQLLSRLQSQGSSVNNIGR